MISYELAKQLKDAGFPQEGSGKKICEPGNTNIFTECYFPSLSELIEACMDFYYPSSFEMGGMNTWWAIIRENKIYRKALVPVQMGKTPEEAVAHLWIELNKRGTVISKGEGE